MLLTSSCQIYFNEKKFWKTLGVEHSELEVQSSLILDRSYSSAEKNIKNLHIGQTKRNNVYGSGEL